jgi:predicted MFS family arabinose efflux permease
MRHAPAAAAGSLRWRIGFTALLTSGMVLAIFSAPVVSVLASFLIEEFGVSRTGIGWLLSIYAAVGAVGSTMAGRLSDSLGGRVVLAGTFAVAGIGLLGIALAPSYAWLVGMALVSGVAWATANQSTNKLVASHIPRGRQGLIMGVKQSGVQTGFFLGGALLPAGALTIGWRPTVALAAVACGIGLVAALAFLPREPRSDGRDVGPEHAYRRSPTARWLAGYALLMGAGMGAVSTYLPLFAQESVGLTAAMAGGVASLSGFVGIASRILWSRGSERGTHHGRSLAAMAVVSIVAVVVLWSSAELGAGALWLGAVVTGAAVFAWNAVVMLAAVSGADPRHAGRASGLVHFGFLVGLTLGPVTFGSVVDLTSTYAWGWAGVIVLFAAGAAVAALWIRSDRSRSPV